MASPIQVQKFLKGVDYPASKTDLVSKAKENGADPGIMAIIDKLPDRDYPKPSEVSKEVGKIK